MKSFIVRLRTFYKRVVFGQSLLGLLVNPFYISRRGLLRGIKEFSGFMDRGVLLDVGCGGKPYRRYFSVDSYFGMDIEQSGHDHSYSQVDVFYDGQSIPFPDECFDHVFSSEVFEHVSNLDELIAEINRVTKRGGTLLVTLPFVWDEHEIPYDFARYSSYGIHNILERSGYKVIGSRKTTSYIGAIFQMLAAYVAQVILPDNRYIRIFLVPFLVAPINLLGLILSAILPDNGRFYLNNVIYCEKQS